MDVRLKVNIAGVERELQLIVGLLRLDSIDAALQKYGETWLKQRVQAHIDAARPPQKDAATGAQGRATSALRVKLLRDVRRATKRLGKVQEVGGFQREAARQELLAAKGKRSRVMSDVVAGRAAALERRESVLAELERLSRGGSTSVSLLKAKAGEKLQARLGRAIEKEKNRKPLGRIAQSFKLEVKDGRLTYGSEIEWAGVHNEGGTVGHGAQIKPNPFAYLEDADLEVLVAALLSEGVIVH